MTMRRTAIVSGYFQITISSNVFSFQHNQQNVLSGHSQQSSLASQSQNAVSAPLYNTMVISQPTTGNVVQVPSSLPQNNNQNAAAVTTFTQDRQIR